MVIRGAIIVGGEVMGMFISDDQFIMRLISDDDFPFVIGLEMITTNTKISERSEIGALRRA